VRLPSTGVVTSGRVVLDIVLPAESASPGRARRAIAAHFRSHPRLADLVLCVSEAVTNAVVHAGTELRLVARSDGPTVRVEVTDDGGGRPRRRNPPPSSPSGRGVLLIDLLSARWGVDDRGPGKTLWLELA
jgi:anti-sigma regulatory factor (Ser/Thr protein kinase)